MTKIICNCCEVDSIETFEILKNPFYICDICREYCRHMDFPVKKNNFKRRLVAEYKKHNINIRLNYFDKKLYSIHNNSTNELISDLFVRTFDDLAVIKNTTRRKIQLIICAKIHKTTPAIAEEIIENNGLFYAIPIDKKLLNSIRGFLN